MVENAALRALRLLDLVPYISSNPGIRVSELAEEFSVTQDEILKDLNLLFLCGLPGYTPLELIDLSFDDGYVVIRDPQNLNAPRNLNESECLALRIALAALEEITPKTHRSFSVLQSLQAKLSQAFSSEIPAAAINFEADKDRIHLDTIKKALESNSDLKIEYFNQTKDSLSLRHISPIGISIDGEKVQIRAYCHVAQGMRTFSLRNISAVESTPRTVEHNFSGDDNSAIEVRFKVSEDSEQFLKENRESLTPFQSNELGFAIYTIQVFQPEWIMKSAISENLQIEEPGKLRSAIKDRCSAALENYAMIG